MASWDYLCEFLDAIASQELGYEKGHKVRKDTLIINLSVMCFGLI